MKKTTIITIISIIILAVLIIFCIGLRSTNNVKSINLNNNVNVGDIEESLKQAYANSREVYSAYDETYFDVFFAPDYVSNFLDLTNIEFANNVERIDYTNIEIYDSNNNVLKEFPTEFEDGSELIYENNAYKVEANKNYLIKVYSIENNYTYYYSVSLNNNGSENLKFLCYTIGEEHEIY